MKATLALLLLATLCAGRAYGQPDADLLGPEIPISPRGHVPRELELYAPLRMASDGEHFLVLQGDRAARFTRDGTLLDPFGFAIGFWAHAVVWTGTHYLAGTAMTSQSDEGTRMIVRVQTITRDGVVAEWKDVGIEPGYDLEIGMATNGRTVAMVLARTTAFLLDPDGNLLSKETIAPLEGKCALSIPSGIAPIRDGYAIAYQHEGVKLVTLANDGVLSAPRTIDPVADFPLIASNDGVEAVMVWRTVSGVRSQRIGGGGIPRGTIHDVPIGRLSAHRLVPFGSGFLLLAMDFVAGAQYGQRLDRNGAPSGPFVRIGDEVSWASMANAVARADGTLALAWVAANEGAAAVVDAWPPPEGAVEREITFAMTVIEQQQVRMAVAGDQLFVGWTEKIGPRRGVRLANAAARDAALVVKPLTVDYVYLVDVIVDSGVVWVLWTEDFNLFARRYTRDLQPIDAGRVHVGERGNYDGARAAGGGMIVVTSRYGKTFADVLYPDRDTIGARRIALADDERTLEVAWDGSAFVAFSVRNAVLDAVRFDTSGIVSRQSRGLQQGLHISHVLWGAVEGDDGITLLWEQYWPGDGARVFAATYRNDLPAFAPKELFAGELGFGAVLERAPNGDLLVVRRTRGYLSTGLLVDVVTPDLTVRRSLETAVPSGTLIEDVELAGDVPVLAYVRQVPEHAWRGFFRTMDLPAKQRAVR